MSLSNIKVVLVGPLYGGNVGSICRAMANTGLSNLTLVAPALTLNYAEARMMAVAADSILEGRKEVSTLEEAVGDCGLVMGTTARLGLYRQHARTPREWAPSGHSPRVSRRWPSHRRRASGPPRRARPRAC